MSQFHGAMADRALHRRVESAAGPRGISSRFAIATGRIHGERSAGDHHAAAGHVDTQW